VIVKQLPYYACWFFAASLVVVACGDDDGADFNDSNGGEDSGGASSGGAGRAGSAGRGGTPSTGGVTNQGGSATGGSTTGGSATGGGATGGTATGGSTTGGSATGGSATGGSATGGTATGGGTMGGAAMGGESGAPQGGAGEGGTAGVGGAAGGGAAGEGGSSGASEGGAPTEGGMGGSGGDGGAGIVADTIDNPGFEEWSGNPIVPGWTIVGDSDAAKFRFVQGDAHSGSAFLDIWRGTAYTVTASQVVSPLPNGNYSFSIWHKGGAYTKQYVFVRGHDASNPSAELFPVPPDTTPRSAYGEITISSIPVTSGKVEIGIYSEGADGNWSHFDDAVLTREP
jgi:hypothetical protein